MFLLAIYMASLEKCLFSSANILIRLFKYWFIWTVFIWWTLIPYLSSHFQIFSPIQWELLGLLMVSLAVQKPVHLIRSHLFIFSLVSFARKNRFKKTWLRFMSEYIVYFLLGYIFRPLIHFELSCIWCNKIF